MNKISVIVPVYRAESVLKRCVDSILSQTYENLELILIDDGSPDRSGEICDRYAENDARVQVIHKENGGVAAARNSGLDVATGDYCTFVDSDDCIEHVMYQSMMEIAVQYDCDVVMCDCVKEYGDRTEIYTHNIRSGYYSRSQIEEEYFPHLLMMPNVEYPPTISNWLCIYRQRRKPTCNRKDTKNNNILSAHSELCMRYEEGIRFSEDLLFGAELLYHANSFYYMKGQCFYHYYMNPQSATHTFVADKWQDYSRLYKRIEDKFSGCGEYDFSHQIDLVLLFFVYNAVGDIISTTKLEDREKMQKCNEILQNENVRQMFSRLHVWKLPIPTRLKLLTIMYKYRIGMKALIVKAK